jgi:hypothetical protein
MERTFAEHHYSTVKVSSVEGGYDGYELMRLADGVVRRVARILYIDATGHYWLETFETMIPLEILEELIEETKGTILFK